MEKEETNPETPHRQATPAGMPQPRPGQSEDAIDHGAEFTNPALRTARFDSRTTVARSYEPDGNPNVNENHTS